MQTCGELGLEYNSHEWATLYRLLREKSQETNPLFWIKEETKQKEGQGAEENEMTSDFAISLQSLPQTYVDSLKVGFNAYYFAIQ